MTAPVTHENLSDGELIVDAPTMPIGERLRELRLARSLSLRDVGELVGGQLSWQGLARIERGERTPGSATLILLAGALNVRFVTDVHGVRLIELA